MNQSYMNVIVIKQLQLPTYLIDEGGIEICSNHEKIC